MTTGWAIFLPAYNLRLQSNRFVELPAVASPINGKKSKFAGALNIRYNEYVPRSCLPPRLQIVARCGSADAPGGVSVMQTLHQLKAPL